MKNPDPQSLLNISSQYLVAKLREIVSQSGLYILILDKQTEKLLLRLVPKDTLLRIVTSIDIIDAPRKNQPFLEAIYFLDPLIYHVNCIAADISAKRYKKGHGLFIPFLQWDTEKKHHFFLPSFMDNPEAIRYFGGDGSTVGFIHASMYPLESRVFLSDQSMTNSMPVYYNENCSDMVLPMVRNAAKAIVSAIIVAQEYPLIRYYSLPQATHPAARLPELLADEVQRQIDDYAREDHNYPPPSTADKPRAILLITDRSMDLFAPLLHEFSYQAMAFDIVESLEREGVYRYKSENEKGQELEMKTDLDIEDDETWVSLRHMHIIESSELIINRINELIKSNPMMVDRSRAKTSSDLMYVVAHLLGFDEERKQVTLHKTLIDEILDINARRKLAEFAADFEQTCCAEGNSFEGVHNKTLHEDLIALLARDDLHVNDKMRLVLIYGLYRGGLAESDFVKIAKFIGVKNTQIVSLVLRCFYNLYKLDFPIVKKSPKDKKIQRQFFHTINNEGTYNTSRFAPGLKRVLYNAAKHELDEDWFPYYRDKPLNEELPRGSSSPRAPEGHGSLRNARIKASWAPTATRHGSIISLQKKQRVFCYVAGGVTYSEMRAIYELSGALNKDFYLGSECILKPRDFLIGLQNIDNVKQPDQLELPLWREMTRPKLKAPSYLLELPKPQEPAPVPSSAGNRNSSGTTNGPSSDESSLKSHKKKASKENASPTKEKKTSRLKRLFK